MKYYYYYKDKLIKKSQVADYKYTVVDKNGHPSGLHRTYKNAEANIKTIARMRKEYYGCTFEQAYNELKEVLNIVPVTRIEA